MKKKIVIPLCICIGCACFIVGVLMALLVFTRPVDNIEIQRTFIEKESSNRDFIVQVAIAIGTVGAVVFTLILQLNEKLKSPKLKITIKKDTPCYNKELNENGNVSKHFYRFILENTKPITAQDVKIQLLKVKNLKTNNYETIYPMLFNWAYNGGLSQDIPYGYQSFCDFIYITNYRNTINASKMEFLYTSVLHFFTEENTKSGTLVNNSLKNGDYKVYFRVIGSNFKPQTYSLHIKLSFEQYYKLFDPTKKTAVLDNSITPYIVFDKLNESDSLQIDNLQKEKL